MSLVSRHQLMPLTGEINGAAIDVHRVVGPGLLESPYQACLEFELARRHLAFKRQVPVPLIHKGVEMNGSYRVDLLVEDQVVVEVKSVERIALIHIAQMITYLKLLNCPVGLLLNFNVTSMRQGIRRILPAAQVKQRLATLAGRRMTGDGVLVIDSREHSTQSANRDAARGRLGQLLAQASVRPKRRRKTRPTTGSHERRITSKVKRGETKRARRDQGDG